MAEEEKVSKKIVKFNQNQREAAEACLEKLTAEFNGMDPLAAMMACGLTTSMISLREVLRKEKEGVLTQEEWIQDKELISAALGYHGAVEETVGYQNITDDARSSR